MNRSIKSIAAGAIFVLTMLLMSINSYGDETNPITNNGKKWRVGYLEGGPYYNYQSILKFMIEGLMHSGWIQHASIPKCQDKKETRTLWNFLSTKIQSDYLEFPSDAYWTSKWNKTERGKIKPVILNRLKNSKDIDLMLAFGTWAGQDLANSQHNTSTMVLSASNAIRSGIIKSVENSGFDHIHASIDPKKSERQLRLFHEIAGFKKLGLAYNNSLSGRSYAAVEDVMALSKELGFEVVECIMPDDNNPPEIEDARLVECYEKLAPKIDAVYMTDDSSCNINTIEKLLSPLFKYKVVMFAQTRYDFVKYGVLMGSGRSDFISDAKFYTAVFSKILNGAKPGDLPQEFESPLDIVINLESAKKIGFRFPLDILAGAFEIHETIQNPENEK